MFFLAPLVAALCSAGTAAAGAAAAAGTAAVAAAGTAAGAVAAAGTAAAGAAAAAGTAAAGAAAAAGTAAVGAATAAGTTGLVATSALGVGFIRSMHKGEVEAARKEGFEHGLRQGNIETAKKFEQRFKEYLEKSDANKIATWALGVYVADLDEIAQEELDVIYKKLGDPDSNLVNPSLRQKYKEIYNKTPRFGEIRAKYLNVVEPEFLVELNEYVTQIIVSDQVVSSEEEDFLKYEWYPYLETRGISIAE